MSKPNRMPLFPLRTVLFPGMTLPLIVFEPRYRSLVDYCLENRSPFGVVLIESGDEVATEDGEAPVIKDVGTTARITRCDRLDDGRFLIEVLGESRFRIDDVSHESPYASADITVWPEISDTVESVAELVETVCVQFRDYLMAVMSAENRRLSALHLPSDPTALAFAVASVLDIALEDKQRLLEASTTFERLGMESELLDLLLTLQGAGPENDEEPKQSAWGPPPSPPQEDVAVSKVTRLDGAAVKKMMSRN